MWTHHFATALRAAPALALAAILLVSPAPAGAQDPVGKNYVPEARIQIVLNKVYIKNDHDLGSGEMWFQVRLNCEQVLEPCLGQPSTNLDGYERSFDASSGDTVWLNIVMPRSTEYMNPLWGIEVENGYPLTSYQRYTVSIHLWEKDPLGDWDDLGTLELPVNKENGWGVGAYPLWSGDDYQIGLEIRPSPLPDLRVNSIKILDLPGSTKKLFCMAAENIGVVDAEPFHAVLEIYPADHSSVSSSSTTVGHLLRGESGDVCVEAALPPPGEYGLVAAVNLLGPQREFNLLNNVLRQPYTVDKAVSAPAPMPSPAPVQAQGQADLTVSSIKVNGQAPDGKNDCQDGKNTVAVVVKNGGTAGSGPFDVQLVVDPVQKEVVQQYVLVESVDGLEAGKEQEVRFGGVKLRKGPHSLVAFADLKRTIAESSENNNALELTARCSGAE